jgi:hypothetical protein
MTTQVRADMEVAMPGFIEDSEISNIKLALDQLTLDVGVLEAQLDEIHKEAAKNIDIVKKEEELERENEREALQLQKEAEVELSKALPGIKMGFKMIK